MMNKRHTTATFCKVMALMGLMSAPVFSAEVNIIFIGNSFTMRHELPTLVDALMEEGDPGTAVKTETVGVGGKSLFQFWELFHFYNRLKASSLSESQWDTEMKALQELKELEEPPAFFNDYIKSLPENPFWKSTNRGMKLTWKGETGSIIAGLNNHKKWRKMSGDKEKINFVVLQSWQDVTDSLDSGYMKYAQKFGAVAKEVGAKPVLYLTAPRSQNDTPVTAAVNKDEILATCSIAAKGEKEMNAVVVPVSLALMLAQESKEPIARTLTFRYKKDFHPNNTMAYLTACTFYAALTGKSPEGLKFSTVSEKKKQNIHGEAIIAGNKDEEVSTRLDPDGGPLETVFTDEVRLFLQKTAWEAVQKYKSGQF